MWISFGLGWWKDITELCMSGFMWFAGSKGFNKLAL